MGKTQLVVAAFLIMFSPLTLSADKQPKIETAEPGAGLTVFMDVSAVGRKNRAAVRMTKLHKQHRAKGWVLIDVDPYIENGDLEGFFISYVGRRAPEKP